MEKSFSSIEDFLSDESFRDWVNHPIPETEQHWQNWLAEHPQQKAVAEQAREMILRLNFVEYHPNPAAKQKIFEQVKQQSTPRERKLWPSRTWWGVAASLFLVLSAVAWVYFNSPPASTDRLVADTSTWIEVRNRPGERSEYTLPDGSLVYLNAASTLAYPETFPADFRQVQLQGEAFFEVTHDANRPFRILTDKLTVEVLGTRFNFRSGPNLPAVALVDGKVRLQARSSAASLELSPDQMATFDEEKNSFTLSSFDARAVTGWKDGYLVFREASLVEVVEKLQAWYGVEVVVQASPAASDWSYTASFRQESLENVLRNMQLLRSFDYQIRQDSLILSFQ